MDEIRRRLEGRTDRTDRTDGDRVLLDDYPNYEDDEAVFEQFIDEHTILTPIPTRNDSMDEDDDDESILEEPGTNRLQRVSAYKPQLLKISRKDPHVKNVIEVPLDELKNWDPVRGQDLSSRAVKNTLRYHALFSKVIDRILERLMLTNTGIDDDIFNDNNNGGMVRDSFDILQEQRMANRRERLERIQEQAQNNGGLGPGAFTNETLQNQTNNVAEDEFPPALMRRYELRILPFGRKGSVLISASKSLSDNDNTKEDEGLALRHVRSRSMGRLVTITGMIVRASDVKPLCVVATYTCNTCGVEVYQDVQGKKEFLPPRKCPNPDCGKGDSLHLQTRGSKFIKFQELKIQELPRQVPMGHVPRSMPIHCRGDLTRIACPGDIVTVDGIFLPMKIAEGGYRAMKAGLISTTYLEAMNINVHKKSFDSNDKKRRRIMDPEELSNTYENEEEREIDMEIMRIATGDDPIFTLSQSMAPEIYGHEDIKRALLLQLVGGAERRLPDGMRIRGDINICLMGDPGVAKSQLLKHVSTIAPRGVYTTGRGSSGVGLTAAVTKDSVTGEMALEGGALVLADKGICCIDEFDKMDESDRTAIHEVMEQQTVSIAKAGIVATLNARCAVLAAANPLYGRYNPKRSLSENVNLPNSLLSRFDLMFLILDKSNVDKDMALARHVTFVHQNNGIDEKENNSNNNIAKTVTDEDSDSDDDSTQKSLGTSATAARKTKHVSPEVLREYISRAREYHPVVPQDVAPYVVEAYVGLRHQDQSSSVNGPANNHDSNVNGDQTVMTARQLLSILRLSQALARLRFSDFVAREDVDEAIRLTHMSKASLLDDDMDGADDELGALLGGNTGGGGGGGNNGGNNGQQGGRRGNDVVSRIFNIIREYSIAANKSSVEMKICEAMVLRKGFTAAQLQTCLEEYQSLDVIHINSSGTHIEFMT